MIVTKRYNQFRRDLSIDMECEGCGATKSYHSAYDDRNFWDNVVPQFKCPSCDKSTIDLGKPIQSQHTVYPEGFQI